MTHLNEEVRKRMALLEFLRGTRVEKGKHIEKNNNQNSLIKILREVGIFKGDVTAKCNFNQIEQALNLFIFRNPSRITMSQLEVILKELKSLIELNTRSKSGSYLLSIEEALDWIVYKVCLHTELNKLGSYSKGTSNLLAHIQEALFWRCVTLDFTFSDIRDLLQTPTKDLPNGAGTFDDCVEILSFYFKKTFVAISPDATLRMVAAAQFDFEKKSKNIKDNSAFLKSVHSKKRVSVIPKTLGMFFGDYFMNYYLAEAEFSLLNFLRYCVSVCPDDSPGDYHAGYFYDLYQNLDKKEGLDLELEEQMGLSERSNGTIPKSMISKNSRRETVKASMLNESISSNKSKVEEIEKGNFVNTIFLINVNSSSFISQSAIPSFISQSAFLPPLPSAFLSSFLNCLSLSIFPLCFPFSFSFLLYFPPTISALPDAPDVSDVDLARNRPTTSKKF